MSTSALLLTERPTRSRRRPPAPRRGWGAAVGIALAVAALLLVIVPFAAVVHVVRMANAHATTPTDAIIVLGAAQLNGVPSPVLANRLEQAHELYDAGIAPTIITVGGNQPGDLYTEGDVGRDYLVAAGVPAANVVAVPQGTDTLTSLTAVADVMAAMRLSSATIVSDPTHMARSVAIADRLGIRAQPNATHGGDGTEVTEEYVARETVGYLFFVLAQQWSVPRVVPPATS